VRCIGNFRPRCLTLPIPIEKPLKIDDYPSKNPSKFADYVIGPLPKNAPKISKKIRENILVRLLLNRSFYQGIVQTGIALG